MPTWSVHLWFTEPTYDLARDRPPTPRSWTWTGDATTEKEATALATAAFRALFTRSGVGWVREIFSIDAQQLCQSLPARKASR